MKRRDLIIGSATGLLVPAIGRVAVPCPPSPVSVADGTSATTSCSTSSTSYTTEFPLTENPISEGGRWTSGAVFGKTNVQTGAGKAYGTMTSFNGSSYVDSCAHLSGFGANQEVTCTVANAGAQNGLEVEILLRADFTAAHAFAYEVDCVYNGLGIALVRWDMTTANPNSFTFLRNMVGGEAPFADGDQVYASIVGTLITVKYRRGSGTLATLFTHDTAQDSTKLATGNPGIGFWNETGNASIRPNFGWSNFTANTL